MYRIKTNGNVNLAINDIKIAVSASNEIGMLVDKYIIDNSTDAQKLIASNLLIVVDANSSVSTKKLPLQNKKNDSAIFVTEGLTVTNPEDLIVRTPEKKQDTPKVIEVQSDIKEDKKVDSKIIVVKEETIVSEKTPDIESVESTKEVEVKEVKEVKEQESTEVPVQKKVEKKKTVNRKQ